ncbi:hypothetical protein Pint_21047 [Pistacia integerrima]|uniref:Uncharacterized protein n=1 Tax=Pistacia integerrima TaxID=434235 RepID=A0ACC0X958_9ROSI|nr:hypothetical protein Pint_21047 [Pistacia integerrima]
MKGLIWATAEDMAKNRGRVLSLYREILRSLNSPKLELSLAARLSKKAEARAIFMLGCEERSIHNIEDLIDTAEYALSHLKEVWIDLDWSFVVCVFAWTAGCRLLLPTFFLQLCPPPARHISQTNPAQHTHVQPTARATDGFCCGGWWCFVVD